MERLHFSIQWNGFDKRRAGNLKVSHGLMGDLQIMPEITTELGRVMVQYEVIPQVISSQPNETCEVIFPPNDLKINPGDMIYNSSTIKLQPSVQWTCNMKKNYTLLFHNLDGKKRMTPLDSWIVVNIPQCNLSQGETVCPYHEPVLRDGRNRFVFLIYEQLARINYFHLMWGDIHVKRAFKPHQFAYTHFLEGPVSANFFYIENKEIYPFWEDVIGDKYPYALEIEKPTTRAII
ncbi:large ribosomal subunit protein mL38-like isoform X2 [Planococcus citri]|uniref:large ribosomal subunit protein mL38-like isoform X2 n=1 Tax=Planococcus citri TaxID=170843 RepID=UPI0031F89936